jgi:hypothetical protein
MDPLLLVVVPGLLGGLIIALIVIARPRGRRAKAADDAFSSEFPSTDVINAARIRVAGIGGLGLVAMATVVALFVPRIRFSLGLGLGLGVLLAAVLILRRRREGPMPSSGRRLGANTTLSIDSPQESDDDRDRDPSTPRLRTLAAASVHRA